MAYTGQEIRQHRQRARLTQRQLAERIGASERAVNRWEAEGIPDGAQYLGALEQAIGLGDGGTDPGTADALRRASDLELMGEVLRRLGERHRPNQPAAQPGHDRADSTTHTHIEHGPPVTQYSDRLANGS